MRAIIDALGGLDGLKRAPISLTVPGYMPLSVEFVGAGPRGGMLISIMHTFEQNGDLMRDPDVVVELIPPVDWWLPISYRQDGLGLFQEAVARDGDRLITHSRLVDSIKQFLGQWDRNLGEQGFVEAARRVASGTGGGNRADPGDRVPH
ncbi:hypothetical protein R5W24_005124 [Gemmata sp. JC717]|uniref:DUF6908 domain-containing protein n=1 Tax=Gemmata algarum TaxID=2975278 RepID=UPI0021BAA42A|nr:hypothetical protein [Gemmata algarum]MDY3555977.1 hypothetical protein [Gemmata algarum]